MRIGTLSNHLKVHQTAITLCVPRRALLETLQENHHPNGAATPVVLMKLSTVIAGTVHDIQPKPTKPGKKGDPLNTMKASLWPSQVMAAAVVSIRGMLEILLL